MSDRIEAARLRHGGPFARQQRRFVTTEPILGVSRKPGGRHRLDAPGCADAVDGLYRFEIVNDETCYVWVRQQREEVS